MDWEDQHQEEEEAFQYLPHAQLALAFEKTIIYECDTLVIAEHGPAALFAYSLVGSAAPVNRLNFSKAKQSALADLYLQQDRKTYYLIFKGQTEPMKEVHFTDFLESWLKSKKVILLLSVSRTTLKDSNSPPLAVFFSLFSAFQRVLSRRVRYLNLGKGLRVFQLRFWCGGRSTECQWVGSQLHLESMS